MIAARRFAATLLFTWLVFSTACDDPVDPTEYHILGYFISGQASGTDPATGEALACAFSATLDTGGPLIGSWTDTTTIRVLRMRNSPSQGVTYDTTLAAQEATITVSDSTHIQFSVNGPFTENLTAEMTPAYPGYGQGDWTCRPDHPLDRVQPGMTLPGKWNTSPTPDLPIG